MWFFVHKMSSNTNIKFIRCFVDGMQLMIFGELGIVGSEESPTYKTKEKKKKGNNQDTTISNIGIQNCFATFKIALAVMSTCTGMKDQSKQCK